MYPHHLHTPERPSVPGGCAMPRDGRMPIEIILMKDELVHDIKDDIINIERTRNIKENPITLDDASANYQLKRLIDSAVNKVVRRMSAYLLLPSPFVHRVANNHAGDWEEKSIYLGMPYNWPPHLLDSLRDAVHDYIVTSTEYALVARSLPQDSYLSVLYQRSMDSYNDINSYINDRLGVIEITPSEFG